MPTPPPLPKQRETFANKRETLACSRWNTPLFVESGLAHLSWERR